MIYRVMRWLASLFFWIPRNPVAGERVERTHDYTQREWGHDFMVIRVLEDGKRLRMSGWGPNKPSPIKLQVGDYLLLPNKNKTTRYRVVDVRYEHDPNDMWHAIVEFAPRKAS